VRELVQTIRESAFGLIALLAVSSLAVGALARHRRRAGMVARSAVVRSSLDVAAVALVIAVLVLTFAPSGQYQSREIHLLPFADFRSTVSTRGVLNALAQATGNMALFVPLGLVIPLRWTRLDGWVSVAAAAAAFSASIETVQFVLGSGHTASTDDVVWNTLGALLGYSLLRVARRMRSRRRASDPVRARARG